VLHECKQTANLQINEEASMASLNKCMFIGNLGADPEVRRTQDGKPIVNMRIACSESWRDQRTGERKEKTEWVTVVIFNEGLAGIAEKYLRKGSKVYVEGKMTTRKWQDKDGHDRYSTEIVLQNFNGTIVLLDGAQGRGQGDDRDGYGAGAAAQAPSRKSAEQTRDQLSRAPSNNYGSSPDDEIPF
jgi:single-strand DNA-binding protein